MKTPSLYEIISTIESNAFLGAMRFEQAVYKTEAYETPYVRMRIKANNFCSLDTARVISSTSWGMYQIMGFNLYEYGYNSGIGKFLSSSKEQDRMFETFLHAKNLDAYLRTPDILNDPEKRKHFALMYNGGAAYANRIEEVIEDFARGK